MAHEEAPGLDPDETLQALQDAIHQLKLEIANSFGGGIGDAADKVIAQFEALDTWLEGGGYMPNTWRGSQRASQQRRIVRNQVLRGPLTDRIYYVPKAAVIGTREDGSYMLRVIGDKIDITEQVEALFAKPKRQAPKKKKAKTRKKAKRGL